MRISEVLLRLGCNLVGWLIIYSHCIWLGVIPQLDCGPETIELYRLALGFSPITIAAALLLGLAQRLTGVVNYLRWLALPLVLLVPLTLSPILSALQTTTLAGLDFCEPFAAANWQRVWAPVQILTLLVIVVAVARFVLKRKPVVA